MGDFVDQADLVAPVRLGPSTALPDVKLEDHVAERLVARATVVDAVKGAAVGEEVKLFHAVRVTDPTHPERGARLQTTKSRLFEEGDLLVVSLTAADEKGERELLAPEAFFVDRDGVLDAELARLRARCEPSPVPLFEDAEGLTTAELLAAAKRER